EVWRQHQRRTPCAGGGERGLTTGVTGSDDDDVIEWEECSEGHHHSREYTDLPKNRTSATFPLCPRYRRSGGVQCSDVRVMLARRTIGHDAGPPLPWGRESCAEAAWTATHAGR